jgi:hypothetical protein
MNSVKRFSDENMLKDQMTPGTPYQIDWSKTYVGRDWAPYLSLCLRETEKNSQSTLNVCDSSQEVAIYITPDGHIKPTTIVIYSEPKKTPEKSGVQ